MPKKSEAQPASSAHEQTRGGAPSATPAAPASRRPEQLAGNFAVQRIVQASMRVGRADDPQEEEADRVADAIASPACTTCSSSAPCAKCGGGKKPHIARKTTSGASSRSLSVPSSELARLGSGSPLDGGTRGRMQQHFGRDLDGVRVHTGGDAERSARSLDARAYTAGNDIVFGRGEYRPGTADGDRLLAHELTHVAQQSEGNTVVQRDGPAPQPAGPNTTDPSNADFDPCAVNVFTLTNERFVAVLAGVKRYIESHERGENALWYDFHNLYSRLMSSRNMRMQAGHIWIGQGTGTVPATLYELRSGLGNSVQVVPANASAERGMPRSSGSTSVISAAQLETFLNHHHIDRVDAQAYFARQDPRAPVQPLTFLLPSPAPEPPRTVPAFSQYTFGAGPLFDPLGQARADPLSFLRPQQPGLGTPGVGLGMGGPPAWWWQAGGFQPPAVGPQRFGAPNVAGAGFGEPFFDLTGQGTDADNPNGPRAFGPSAVTGGRLYVDPYAVSVSPFAARQVYTPRTNMANPRSTRGAEVNWRGNLPELSFGRGTISNSLTFTDLNTVSATRNFPVWDWRSRLGGDLVSVTHTLPNAQGQVSFEHYDTKFMRAIGAQQTAKFNNAIQQLNTAYGTTMTPLDASSRTYLAINDDHVLPYRQRLRTSLTANPSDYSPLLDALITEAPVNTGGTAIRTWNDLEAARANGRITQAQFDTTVASLADRAANRVISNGLTTAEIQASTQFRIGTQNLAPADFTARVPPELLEANQLGRVTGPGAVEPNYGGLAWRSGVRGAGAGAGMTAVMDAGRFLMNPGEHPHWATEGAIDVTAGGVSSFVGSSIEAPITAYSASAFADVGGAAGAFGRVGGRFLGGSVGGGVAAPVFTLLAMGLDPYHDYTSIDYWAKGTRAAVSGGIAGGGGALAAAGYGALAGTEGGPVGWVVGAGVGLIIYWIADDTVGEGTESLVRSGMGEGGCVGGGVRARAREGGGSDILSQPEPRFHYCFTAQTMIALAGGGQRPIAAITVGDEVLAYDETASRVVAAQVTRLIVHEPALWLSIRLDDGSTLEVTPEHPLHADGSWILASDIRIGTQLSTLADGGQSLSSHAVVSIEHPNTPEPVWTLEVEPAHTFFANRVLAHNKNM